MKLKSSAYTQVFEDLATLTSEEVAKYNSPHSIPLKTLVNVIGHPATSTSYSLEDITGNDIINDDTITDDDWEVGLAECEAGRVAIVISLNDVCGLLPIPKFGMALIIHLLNQARAFAKGRDVDIPVVLMVPEGILRVVQAFVSSWALSGPQPRVVVRPSTLAFEALGSLSRDPEGRPVPMPTGSGDVWDTLVSSGVADELKDVTNFIITFGKNGLWTPHLGILGQHVRANGKITVEIAYDHKDDLLPPRFPCYFNGDLVILEAHHYDVDEIMTFASTDNYIISRDALSAPIEWSWKKRRRQEFHNNKICWVPDRSITQLTMNHRPRLVLVDRELRYHSTGETSLKSLGQRLCVKAR